VKNIGVLIDVFDLVQRAVPAKLLLVGEGPEISLAKRRVGELGIEARVSFLGSQECMEDLLPIADLFLLPSLHESFGLSALEAMACGVVVIATSVGGTREVVEDGVSGFLRHPTDVSGWSGAALDVLRDPDLRARLSAAAREAAKDHFCRDRVIDDYEEEYRRAVESAARAAGAR
jgi:N-acetyl-alpha-D-glucosaminyl L-malate synthase BshA